MTEGELQAVERKFADCRRKVAERRGELNKCAECPFADLVLDCLNETAGEALAEYCVTREHAWDDRYARK